jgi:hypothetical protein
MTEAGIQPGQPPSPDALEKARKLAEAKGIDPEMITRMTSRGGAGRRGGAGGAASAERGGATNAVTTRTIYKMTDAAAINKIIEPVMARLGISDGFFTEVLSSLNEGDTIVTGVIMPGAAPVVAGAQSSGMQNPFSGSSRSGMRGR